MKKLMAIGALTALAVLGGCSKPAATQTADPAAIADAVKGEVAALVTSFNNRDAAGAVSHDEPGYIGMFHGTPNTVGMAADLAMTKLQVSDPAAKVTVGDQTVDVAMAGDMAIDRATYEYTFTDPKTHQPKVETGNWILSFRKQPDLAWKLAWSVISDTGSTPVAPATKL